MADWIIAETGGEANALVLSVNETVISPSYVSGFVDEFSELCSGCESRVIDFPIAQIATRGQAQVQTALVADPDINYVVPIYDELFIPSVLAAINTAGVVDRVKIVSSDGTPSSLESIQEGDTVEMDVGFGLDWVAHAVIDQHLRNFAGLEPPNDSKVGVRVFSDANVDEAGVPPVFEKGYGEGYKQGYRELWQVA
jgi:ribose transport system substrate-binding protein